MRVLNLILKMTLRIMLIPIWMILALVWLSVMVSVRIGCIAKGFLSFILLFILIGTLIWYRTNWMGYVLLAIAEGMLFSILFAGVFIEELLSIGREKVGDIILYSF